jgi:hypothetical protein
LRVSDGRCWGSWDVERPPWEKKSITIKETEMKRRLLEMKEAAFNRDSVISESNQLEIGKVIVGRT